MGYRLRIVAGPGQGSEVNLDSSEVTIGRAPENALVINDNNVSRVHAKVRVEPGNRIVVADNGSRNGVFVNDRKISQQPISPGDRVVIGQTVLELVSDARSSVPARVPPAKAVRTGASKGSEAAVAPSRAKSAIPVPRTGGQAGPRTGAQRPPAKNKGGGIPKPALLAIVGVLAAFAGFAVLAVIQGRGTGSTAAPRETPLRPPPTPPSLPGTGGFVSSGEKCNKAAQQAMDVGDSNRDSGNLPKARESFRLALKYDPGCRSATVRLGTCTPEGCTGTLGRIEEKIRDYEKAGAQLYESGDYLAAIDRWEIAIEFIADSKDSRTGILKSKIQQAKGLIQKQPQ